MVNLWYLICEEVKKKKSLRFRFNILKRAFHCKEVVKIKMYLSGFNIILFKYLFYFLIVLMLRVYLVVFFSCYFSFRKMKNVQIHIIIKRGNYKFKNIDIHL